MSGDAAPGTATGQPATVVVGAGIIGLSAALALQQRGRRVIVIDRTGVAAGASRGNAGAFAFSDILPLASPGIWRQVPRWLLHPLGPLALRPAYLPRMAPWLLRFFRASLPDRVAASTAAQVELMRLSAAALPSLLKACGAEHLLHAGGNLHLYDNASSYRASLRGWQVRADHGIAHEHVLGPDAIAQLQPGLSSAFGHGVFVPDWKTIDDPAVLCELLFGAVIRNGGTLQIAEVDRLEPQPDRVDVCFVDGSRLAAQAAVVAAGAWSHRMALSMGDRIPLDTERGYNTTLPPGAFDLRRQVTFCDHAFVATPIGGGVRIGGAVEFAGLEAPPNFARSRALLHKASRFMPQLRTVGGVEWMGCRPSLPDSLPAIGPASADQRVVYAFGHGHLGLTQAAGTAQVVAALLEGLAAPIALHAFRPQRFHE